MAWSRPSKLSFSALMIALGQAWSPLLHDPDLSGLHHRWIMWQRHFDVYGDLTLYPTLNRWKNGNKFQKLLLQVKKSLDALTETFHLESEHSVLTKFAILHALDIELLHLELKFLTQIEKDKGSTLLSHRLKKLNAALLKQQKKSKKIIIDFNKRLSIQAKNVQDLPALMVFFRHYKKFKFYFDHSGMISEETSDLIGIANTLVSFLKSINGVIPEILNFFRGAAQLLKLLPLISAIASVVPFIIDAIKSWVKNERPIKKFKTTGSLLFVIGGILAAAFITAASTVIASSLLALGVIVKFGFPWITTLYQKSTKRKEILLLEKRKETLKSGRITSLSTYEKHTLMRLVENYWLSLPTFSHQNIANLHRIKRLIANGDNIEAISFHPFIQMSLYHESHRITLEDWLLKKTDEKIQSLNEDIRFLKKISRSEGFKLINGAISIAGAILVCIPTPITLITGAAILLSTAIIGVALKYHWFKKIRRLFTKSNTKNQTDKEISELTEKKSWHFIASRLQKHAGKIHSSKVDKNNASSETQLTYLEGDASFEGFFTKHNEIKSSVDEINHPRKQASPKPA